MSDYLTGDALIEDLRVMCNRNCDHAVREIVWLKAEVARLKRELGWPLEAERERDRLRADAERMAAMLSDVATLNCGPDAALHWWADRGRFVSKYALAVKEKQT